MATSTAEVRQQAVAAEEQNHLYPLSARHLAFAVLVTLGRKDLGNQLGQVCHHLVLLVSQCLLGSRSWRLPGSTPVKIRISQQVLIDKHVEKVHTAAADDRIIFPSLNVRRDATVFVSTCAMPVSIPQMLRCDRHCDRCV